MITLVLSTNHPQMLHQEDEVEALILGAAGILAAVVEQIEVAEILEEKMAVRCLGAGRSQKL